LHETTRRGVGLWHVSRQPIGMRRWPAHALVLTILLAGAILTSRLAEATIATPVVANTSSHAVPTQVPEADAEEKAAVATEPAPDNGSEFTAEVERWRSLSLTTSDLVLHATGVRVDDDLLLALVDVESGGDPGARSRAGAVGLTQVEPATFHDLQTRHRELLGGGSLQEPRTNLLAGGIYLADCARQLHVDLADPNELELVLKAYNLGPRAASEWRATGTWLDENEVHYALPLETVEHAARIMAAYQNAQRHSGASVVAGQG
jgi:soluble lytic murein transglycosylase-like protein